MRVTNIYSKEYFILGVIVVCNSDAKGYSKKFRLPGF